MTRVRIQRWLGGLLLWAGAAFAIDCALAPVAGAASPFLEVLGSDEARTTVRITAEEGATGEHLGRFSLLVPGPSAATLRVAQLRSRPARASEDAYVGESPATLGPPQKVRHSWIRGVEVPRLYRDGAGELREVQEIVVTVEHGGPLQAEDLSPEVAQTERALLAPAVVNPGVVERQIRERTAPRSLARRAPVEDTFAKSPNWLRLELTVGGVFRLDYQDLRAALGAEAADLVDPATLRLFGAREPLQPAFPSDPRSSWWPEQGLRERALHVETEDTSFGPGDRIWFYAPGPEDWQDGFDSEASIFEHYEQTYATRAALWLTWDEVGGEPSGFASSPARMPVVDARPTGSAPRVLSHARSRLRLEENVVMAYGRVEDAWAWRDRIEAPASGQLGGGIFRHFFDLAHARPESLAWMRTRPIMDPPRVFDPNTPVERQAEYRLNDQLFWNQPWNSRVQTAPSLAPYEITVFDVPAVAGLNELQVENVSGRNSLGSAPELLIDGFSFVYRRDLELDPAGLAWLLPVAESASASAFEFRLSDDAGALDEAVVLDRSDPWQPRWVQGEHSGGGTGLAFELAPPSGAGRYEAVLRENARRPVALRRHRPRLLRHEVSAEAQGGEARTWDMVVLHPDELADSAEDLVSFRSARLDGVASPRVTAVDLQDVYDQFGHGFKDPVAIRNYLRFLFELDGRLQYVVLVGDANRDSRGIIENSDPDLCPTWVQTHWPESPLSSDLTKTYARDDLFVCFDDPPPSFGRIEIDVPDAIIGRIPATNASESRRILQRIFDYEAEPASGDWRNTVLLVADDDVGLAGPNYREEDHVRKAEDIVNRWLPQAFDIDKLYLTDFENVPGSRGKPAARQALRDRWSRGRIIVHYIGHGSPEQMADENVFRIEDVPSLTNAARRPLFLALSCDVAIFDDPIKRSMSEQLVLSDAGGAIATIAATQVTFISANELLTDVLYASLYPSPILDLSEPVGAALWQGKVATGSSGWLVKHNSAKYVVLGDPAQRLQSPQEKLELSGGLSSSIPTGQLVELQGGFADGAPAGMDQGTWYLRAQASGDSTYFLMDDGPKEGEPGYVRPRILPYATEGEQFFDGRGGYEDGSLQTQLRTPVFMNRGPRGRVRLLFESDHELFVGYADSLEVVAGTPDTDDAEGPRIELRFANDARAVTPGMGIRATIEDPSGINTLGTVPANSILIEFDDSGIQTDVTDLFQLDDDDFTKGSLEISLPQTVAPGEHVLALSAGDMMSNVSVEEITFEVVPEGELAIGSHTPFPNPFVDQTRFVVEVLAPAGVSSDLELTIYTVDGNRVETLRSRLTGGGGRISLPWDGRDQRGGEIANGTYLYTLRVDFEGSRPVSETVTGRVVRMR